MSADYEKYLSNPDKIVRDLFTSREDAIPFLRAYLPAELVGILALEKLEYGQGSYIDPRMQEHRTDILFHIPTVSGVPTRLALLFEHKSQVTKATYAQILRYLANIYENHIKDLTPVIPFLFYHQSPGSFRPVHSFAKLFHLPEVERSILQKYISDFHVELFHLASEDPERVRAHLHLYAFIRILRHVDLGDISTFFRKF